MNVCLSVSASQNIQSTWGIHEKGSRDVCTIYTIHLSLCTQTAKTASPEPSSCNPLYYNRCDQKGYFGGFKLSS